MSVMSSLRRQLDASAVANARKKDISQSQFYKAILRREERKRRDDELIALALRRGQRVQ